MKARALLGPPTLVAGLATLLVAASACMAPLATERDHDRGRVAVVVRSATDGGRASQALPAGIDRIAIRVESTDPDGHAPMIDELTGDEIQEDAAATFEDVPAGWVAVTAEIYGPGDRLRGSAKQGVRIFDDQTSQVTLKVRLAPLDGERPEIVVVRVNATEITLNTMPAAGAAEDDLAGSFQAEAMVETAAGDCPDCRVVWSTSEPGLVTVVDGLIRARREAAEGDAVVTATSADEPTIHATISVHVTRLGGLSAEVR